MHVAVIDIGSPGKSLGWAMVGPRDADGDDLDECVDILASALDSGPLALGFEAPMFVPKRTAAPKLTAARAGECGSGHPNRPFSASAGATVLVTALVVVPYVLDRLRARCPGAVATMDWRGRIADPGKLLLFEAFVTNQKKISESRHREDARAAAEAAQLGLVNPDTFSTAVDELSPLSLLGAMMLRTGWGTDLALLSQPCLVVRA